MRTYSFPGCIGYLREKTFWTFPTPSPPSTLESTQCGAETTRTFFFWSPSNKKTNSISKMKKQRALRHRTKSTRFHRCFRNLCLWTHIFTLKSTATATSIKLFTSLWCSQIQQTLGCSWIVKSVQDLISNSLKGSKRIQMGKDLTLKTSLFWSSTAAPQAECCSFLLFYIFKRFLLRAREFMSSWTSKCWGMHFIRTVCNTSTCLCVIISRLGCHEVFCF